MKAALTGLALSTVLLSGCTTTLTYKGKTYLPEQLESVIEAEIAKENPGQTVDVQLNNLVSNRWAERRLRRAETE